MYWCLSNFYRTLSWSSRQGSPTFSILQEVTSISELQNSTRTCSMVNPAFNIIMNPFQNPLKSILFYVFCLKYGLKVQNDIHVLSDLVLKLIIQRWKSISLKSLICVTGTEGFEFILHSTHLSFIVKNIHIEI